MGREGPKILTLLAPPFPTWRNAGCFSCWPLRPILLGYVTFTMCRPQRAHAFRSRVTGHGGACKEATAPGQYKATVVCHRGFPRWDCYSFGFVAGAAYLKRMLVRIPIYLSGEAKNGHGACVSCCPFCTYTIQNDPAYLNHIVCMHYDASFGCGGCLKAITSSGQQMKAHIKECSGLAPLPMASQESAPGRHSPKKSAPDSKHVRSKKKNSCSEKSQLAGQASQDSQASDRCITRMTGARARRPQPNLPDAALSIRRRRRRRTRRRNPASNPTRTPWHVTAFYYYSFIRS